MKTTIKSSTGSIQKAVLAPPLVSRVEARSTPTMNFWFA